MEGTWDADSVYLERVLLDSSDFGTHISYLPGDAVWSNAILLISSFCKDLIDVSLVLEEQGSPFPSGEIELFVSTLGESDPYCQSPTTGFLRVEFFGGLLSGDFVVKPACIAVMFPGTVANLNATRVENFGALFSMDPAPLYTSSNIVISGRTDLAGDVSADSVFVDGSLLGTKMGARSLTTRTLDADSGIITLTGNLSANTVGIGSSPHISLLKSSVFAAQIISPIIVADRSGLIVSGAIAADELTMTYGGFEAHDFDIPLVTMNNSNGGVVNISLVDSLTMTSSAFGGGLSMTAKKITGTHSSLGGSLIQVKQGPALIDLSSSQINAGTLDADFMNLDACSVSFGTIVTKQTIANNSSFQGGLLNARTGRSLFYLNIGSVDATHINAGTYDVRDVATTTDFMEGDTLFTWGGSIHDALEDSLRIQFTHRSHIDSTLVYSGMIYASLAQAVVTPGSRFESDNRGGGSGGGEIVFPGDVGIRGTGGSYGGYGGTTGDMNTTTFVPADDPAGIPDFSTDDVRAGLGGFGATDADDSAGAGGGGGRIRIDASSLVWNGYASVNGADSPRPYAGPLEPDFHGGGGGGGGTGGTVHIEVLGIFSGGGRIESNGGGGSYGFGGAEGFQTGSGGSGGRIRINYGTLGVWNGTVKALGGVGGIFDTLSIGVFGGNISPWIDTLNNGGPGTIYWKQIGGNGRILVDGEGGPGGVGRVDGSYPADTLEVRGALVVTNGLHVGGIKVVNGGILKADNPRIRLRWPPPPFYGISDLFPNPGGYNSGGSNYPVSVWEDSLRERLTIDVAHDVFIDATSRLDLTGQGGYGQADDSFSDGGWGNRAGGSYGGYGGWGRWVNEDQMGKPDAVYGDPLKPEEVGEGGYGERNYVNTGHTVTALGGAGGGALRLTAGGTVYVDGMLVSDGGRGKEDTPAPDAQGTGGGSGGSVWITASSLAGSGTVSASGGDGTFDSFYSAWGGGGGGGRIRIDYGTKSGWSGDVKTFGGRGAQYDSSHQALVPWTNPRMHGGAGTVYWNGSGPPTLEIRNFASDSGTAALSGTFPGVDLIVRSALVATARLAVETLTLEDHAILTANDNRTTLYSFPGNFSIPNRFPFWTPKAGNYVAVDAAGDLSIDATSRIDVSGLGGFSREDFDVLSGAAANPAGGSHGGVGGAGKVGALDGVASPAFGDSARPVSAGLGGFGDESLPPSGVFFDQCGAAGSGGGALRISVGGILNLLGSIRSIGLSGTPLDVCTPESDHTPSGGAGGSVFLAAGQITGSGLIDASGGDGVFNSSPSPRWGGGGGGGRIAVYSVMTGFTGTLRADGGLGGAGNGVDSLLYEGQPGTIVTGTGAPGAAIPFAVLSTSIADGDTGVSRTDPFRLIFNKPARLSSLVFTLSPDPGGWGIRGNFGGDSLWLDHASLAEQTTYILKIVQIHNMFGDTLGAGSAKQWIFSTGGPIISNVNDEALVPLEMALTQNYPNPFNGISNFELRIPAYAGTDLSNVRLTIYDLLGREIATLVNEVKGPGVYRLQWDSGNVPSGVYFARMHAGTFMQTRKIILLR